MKVGDIINANVKVWQILKKFDGDYFVIGSDGFKYRCPEEPIGQIKDSLKYGSRIKDITWNIFKGFRFPKEDYWND